MNVDLMILSIIRIASVVYKTHYNIEHSPLHPKYTGRTRSIACISCQANRHGENISEMIALTKIVTTCRI